MDQIKTGIFLKELRKAKGLTQQQLAEVLNVSSRTVSRWETGSNMPDISMLVEIAVFYDVSIPEIIQGERKSENMDKETQETAVAMAKYSKNAVKILNYIGLLDEFDVIVDGNMIKNSKPDPEVFVLAAKLLNEEKENCLVVEDAVAGVDASYIGGIKALSISSAYKYEKSTYTMKNLSAEKFIKIIEGER